MPSVEGHGLGALLGLVLAAALTLIAVVAAWRALGRTPRAQGGLGGLALALSRLALILVAAAVAGWWPHAMKLGESSWWQCDLCGRVEHRDSFMGFVLLRAPYSDPCSSEVLDAYAALAGPFVGDHTHAWAATLSSYRFPCISCTMLQPCKGWFERLPRASEDLARRALLAFVSGEPETRRRWKHEAASFRSQEDFDRWLAEIFP